MEGLYTKYARGAWCRSVPGRHAFSNRILKLTDRHFLR